MLNKKIEKALQQQLAMEAYSSAIYLSMATWMDVQGYDGTAAFLYTQSDEERMHMLRILHYINDSDGHAKVPKVDQPPQEFKDYHNCFKMVMEQEQAVTASIHELITLSLAERDHATNNFLQWYVTEQMEEEQQIKTILNKLKIIGKDGSGLYLLDADLGKLAGNNSANQTA